MRNLILTLTWVAFVVPATGQTFVDVATDLGIKNTHTIAPICPMPPVGLGSAWADYDNDGDIDLFVTNQDGANYLYRNDGDTDLDGLPNFIDEAMLMGVDQPTEVGHGTVFIDYDNDGDQDLFVGNWGGNSLFENQLIESGTVSFLDVSLTSGLLNAGRVITSAWGDYDDDGDLDVYLAKHAECIEDVQSLDALYRNNGDGTFSDVSAELCDGAAPCAQLEGLGFTAAWFDYDEDGDEDLYLVNDNIDSAYYHNVLWRNDGPDGLGGWLFTDVSAASNTDTSLNGMGLGVGDVDNDGWLDLAFSNIGANELLLNNGDGTFEDVSASAGIERATHENGTSITWGTAFLDYDNDQFLDLFFAAGYITAPVLEHPNAFFKNNGDGTFTDVSVASGLADTGRGRATSLADVDNDGFVDLYVGNYGEDWLLFRNQTPDSGSPNRWLTVELTGTVSNADAIGATLELTTPDGTTQFRHISSGPTHGGGDQRRAFFGLDDQTSGDLVIFWPSGIKEEIEDVSADQHLKLTEPPIELELSLPGGGQAGANNDFVITGGVIEGGRIALYASNEAGANPTPGCKGLDGGLINPRFRGFGFLDANGNLTITDFLPPGSSGRTLYFQVSLNENCRVSPVLAVSFP